MLHALTNYSVDAVLAVILMVGGVIGAQFGARIGQNIRGDQMRALLALLVLAVEIRFLTGLIATPEERLARPLRRGMSRLPPPRDPLRDRRHGAGRGTHDSDLDPRGKDRFEFHRHDDHDLRRHSAGRRNSFADDRL
jgi:hypothetical protein